MPECMSCALIRRRDAGEAPDWDNILRTDHWDVVHNYDTALPGWLVLVARRHVGALAEMTEAEAVELGTLQRDVSRALAEVTGCAKTYVAQFAESPEHPHVHVHVIPRMADIAPEHLGPGVFALMAVEGRRVGEAEMSAIATRLRAALAPPVPSARA
jgi:diadenosine tetraphosphate (Ap4A) HIT family hydrolase